MAAAPALRGGAPFEAEDGGAVGGPGAVPFMAQLLDLLPDCFDGQGSQQRGGGDRGPSRSGQHACEALSATLPAEAGVSWSRVHRSQRRRAKRLYEVQVCVPAPGASSSGSTPPRPGRSLAAAFASAGWAPTPPPETPEQRAQLRDSRNSQNRAPIDEPEVIALAGMRFPQIRGAGLKVKRREAEVPALARDMAPEASMLRGDLGLRDGALPFRAGKLRPRLLERRPVPMDGGGEMAASWAVGLRGFSQTAPAAPHRLRKSLFNDDAPMKGLHSLTPPASQPSSPRFPQSPHGPDAFGSTAPAVLQSPAAARSPATTPSAAQASPQMLRRSVVPEPLDAGAVDRGQVRFATPAATPSAATPSGKTPTSGARRSMTTPKKSGFALYSAAKSPDSSSAALAQGQGDEQPSLVDTEMKESLTLKLHKSSILAKVRMSSDRESRMKRLTEFRKEAVEGGRTYVCRDRMNKRQEVELAQESFARYFPQKTGNPFNEDLILEALADFGIKARTRPEKLGLLELLSEQQRPSFGFGDFCSLAEDAKAKMRQLHSFSAFQAWRFLDTGDRGALPPMSVLKLLEDLGLVPKGDSPERFVAKSIIGELQADEDDLVSFYEAEFAIEEMRLFTETTRRRKERDIQRTYDMSDDVFREFRTQLLSLHSSFERLDEDNSGCLDPQEVINLLAEFGFVSSQSMARTMDLIEEIEEQEDGEITFLAFLKVIKELRTLDMHARNSEVRELFQACDRDRSGELDMREASAVLVSLGLQPRTVREQEGIAQLLEEVDADGSGRLDFQELLVMVQRIAENMAHLKLLEEGEVAAQLNFSPPVVRQLRTAFEAMCSVTHGGQLNMQDVERALISTGYRTVTGEVHKMLQDIDSNQDGELNFCEFLRLIARVDEDHKLTRKIEDASRVGAGTAGRASISRPAVAEDAVADAGGSAGESAPSAEKPQKSPHPGSSAMAASLSVGSERSSAPPSPTTPRERSKGSPRSPGKGIIKTVGKVGVLAHNARIKSR